MANATEEQMAIISKGLGDLAEVVRDMARHIYKNGEMYEGEEDYEMAGDPMAQVGGDPQMGMEEDPTMQMGLGMNTEPEMGAESGMPSPASPPLPPSNGMEEEMFPDEMPEPISQMGVNPMQRSRPARARSVVKGYNNAAMPTASEEDSPFGEQQDSIEGNQGSPAGNMVGDREDETFNVSFQSMLNEVRGIRAALQANGITVKGPVPGLGKIQKGREGNPVIDRDFQVIAKSRTYQELNSLREQVGDLPRHFFGH